MDKVGEIISRVERRRRWTAEQKIKVLTEALEPGATVSAVADRNGIGRSQLYAWMKRAREGDIPGISLNGSQKPLFAPVRIAAVPTLPTPPVTAPAAACPQRRPGAIEIALTNGRVVRAEEGIEPARLARLVAALDGARR
jgi:transposase